MARREERIVVCPECKRPFKYLFPVEMMPEEARRFTLSCPFCGAKLEIDLSRYTKEKILRKRSPERRAEKGTHEEEWIILKLPEKLFPKKKED